jgi:hypothetical protein
MNLLVIMNVGCDLIDQRLIRFSTFLRYWKKWKYNETVHQLFSEEGSIVQYSHGDWSTYETSQVDQNGFK